MNLDTRIVRTAGARHMRGPGKPNKLGSYFYVAGVEVTIEVDPQDHETEHLLKQDNAMPVGRNQFGAKLYKVWRPIDTP